MSERQGQQGITLQIYGLFSIFANKKPIKNKMKYSDYEIAFSPARLSRYSNACGGDQNKALTLYRHNVKLCQKFYGVLSCLRLSCAMRSMNTINAISEITTGSGRSYNPEEC